MKNACLVEQAKNLRYLRSMDSADFISGLQSRLQTSSLPGIMAHEALSPTSHQLRLEAMEANPNLRLSAVMILLYNKNQSLHFCLIQRPVYEGVHSRQVALPGGKKEIDDPSLAYTALRETEEEVGISKNGIAVIGELTELYIPPSGFLVHPFIGTCMGDMCFVPDLHEVQEIIEVPLHELLKPNAIREEKISVNTYMRTNVPCFVFNNKIVWGATAMILNEFREISLPIYG